MGLDGGLSQDSKSGILFFHFGTQLLNVGPVVVHIYTCHPLELVNQPTPSFYSTSAKLCQKFLEVFVRICICLQRPSMASSDVTANLLGGFDCYPSIEFESLLSFGYSKYNL
jgi:hypothetical protein